MRILSGIQPSGLPHIGNYFGMMKPAVALQEKGEVFLFIADYHSLTTSPSPEDLKKYIQEVAVDFLACGLDPKNTVFFRQSDVPQVTELTWILNCVTSVGLLERAHSYKDKVAKGFVPNNGLFSYPVLMAADILIYRSNIVPVGKDQKQHLEITRDIAQRFNSTYGEIFVVPDEQITENVAVIPGIDGQKMSKSYNNTIPIFGKEKDIKSRIMSIVTDSKGLNDPKDPDKCNVFALYSLFADSHHQKKMRENYHKGGYGYGHAKKELFELSWEYFGPLRRRREELQNDLGYVQEIIREGGEKARAVAELTMCDVRKAVGIR
ncbi:MAG: tryptophan--tRNA ligase [Lentisphaerae bacterium GWF2_45_14]|nr:MAG: tryptophan--tRNA ligase [Lentisphaerae bacterium GWF2_45_14]